MFKPLFFAAATVLVLSFLPAAQAEEKHPNMHKALHSLEHAKADLEKAKHVFGGHRAKALELTDQAIREVKAGLEYARSNEKKK
ncbi:MAG: hypothetical protein ACREUY_05110 [Burkholderiales bacterium]